MTYTKQRILTLDIARAIAIILVAIGHFVVEPMPTFYKGLHDIIYTFHMPLFMFVSGFLSITTMNRYSYGSFLKKKFYRLLIPYFVMSIIIITIKLLSESHLKVEHPVTINDYFEILWLPKAGYFLWFIFALWWMMVIIPFFNTPRKRLLLLILSIPLHLLSGEFTTVFCLSQTASYAIYFSAGMVMNDCLKRVPIRKICMVSFFCFPVLAGLFVSNIYGVLNCNNFLMSILNLITALTGIGFTIAISNSIEKFGIEKIKTVLLSVSGASYIIYLIHTTCMGFAKSILFKLHFLNEYDNSFLNYSLAELIVPIFAGGVVPYFLYIIILRRYRITQFLFGLSVGKK